MRVLICGGAIAGLTLAGCLDQRGVAVLLVERAGRLRDQGYMIDFFGSGYEVSAHLGLLHELNQTHYPVTSLTFVDRRGRVRLSLPYALLRRRLFDDRNFLQGSGASMPSSRSPFPDARSASIRCAAVRLRRCSCTA